MTIVQINKKLINRANKSARKSDKLIARMNKKYGNVSVNSGYNTKTGQNYIDVVLGNNKERIYENAKTNK